MAPITEGEGISRYCTRVVGRGRRKRPPIHWMTSWLFAINDRPRNHKLAKCVWLPEFEDLLRGHVRKLLLYAVSRRYQVGFGRGQPRCRINFVHDIATLDANFNDAHLGGNLFGFLRIMVKIVV